VRLARYSQVASRAEDIGFEKLQVVVVVCTAAGVEKQ
jgi:hypothetical protein